MFWADVIAENIIKSGKFKPYHVDDMKTPSGIAHVGSLRGPIIHSVIYRALKDQGVSPIFTFVINDFDVADELPPEYKEQFKQYMGFPLRLIPSPDKNFDSLGSFLAHDFISTFGKLGVEAKILSSWDMYHQGKFDEVIKTALNHSEKIQDIYQKISGSKKREKGWLPFQPICEKCGKLGTTKVYKWDGEKVYYTCEPNMVVWAKGCGFEGSVTPYGGRGKLPWKVDWPAHWKIMGVTIEGAGKDHASKGGSYDIAMELCNEVFDSPKPYKMPYEFLLFGGKKMSSSKGIGFKAHDIVKILPAEIARFLFVRTDYKESSNFDPINSMAIPDLFDEYDRCWQAFNHGNDFLGRIFVLSQINQNLSKQKNLFLPRFRDVANYLQLSNINIEDRFAELKGQKLDETEKNILDERIIYAKIWIEKYAPDEFKIQMSIDLPEEVKTLDNTQKEYLKKVIILVDQKKSAQELQVDLYNLAKQQNLDIKKAFAAIYLSFIGREHGPRAGWFLQQYPKDQIIKRLNAVVESKQSTSFLSDANFIIRKDLFTIDKEVEKKYPSASVGIAIIKNVKISKINQDLEIEKQKLLNSLSGLTTEKISTYPEVLSYRKLYKETGIDWHSRRPSPEALLRRVVQGKNLYQINTAVDAYNLIVMQYRVSVGAFDLDQMKFPTSLRFAGENDEILLLGDDEPTKYSSREIAYYDQQGGFNIDFNYRDAKRTMVTEKTKNLWINIDGVYDITPSQVEKSLKLTVEKIIQYCGGKVEVMGVVK